MIGNNIQDIFAYASKGCHLLQIEALDAVLFMGHLCSWFVFRCMLYTRFCWFTYLSWALGDSFDRYVLTPLFLSLMALQYYWFYVFVAMLVKILREGDTKGVEYKEAKAFKEE